MYAQLFFYFLFHIEVLINSIYNNMYSHFFKFISRNHDCASDLFESFFLFKKIIAGHLKSMQKQHAEKLRKLRAELVTAFAKNDADYAALPAFDADSDDE